jgi:hypothetical protein
VTDDHGDTPTATYARAPRVLWRRGDDRLLVRRVGDEALELTGVAAFVWSTLDAPRDVDFLSRHLVDELPAGEGSEAHDTLLAALAGLVDRGIVQERR